MRALPVLLVAALAAPVVAAATGFGGSDAPTRVPVPARVFAATITDRTGTVVELTRVTFDGEVFVAGTVGEGQAAVPFEQVDTVRIEPTDDAARRVAFVTLRDGGSVRVVVPDDLPVYGVATWGNYKIEIASVTKLVLKPAAE